MGTPSLMRRWKSSIFLCVQEVSHGSRHLLETIRGSSMQLALGKVRFLPFPWELFSYVAPLLLGTQDGLVSFLPYPIAHWAFLQVYMLGPVHPSWPNFLLGLRPRWGLFHSPQISYDIWYHMIWFFFLFLFSFYIYIYIYIYLLCIYVVWILI